MSGLTEYEAEKIIHLSICETETPHLAGLNLIEYYGVYPDLASHALELAKESIIALKKAGLKFNPTEV